MFHQIVFRSKSEIAFVHSFIFKLKLWTSFVKVVDSKSLFRLWKVSRSTSVLDGVKSSRWVVLHKLRLNKRLFYISLTMRLLKETVRLQRLGASRRWWILKMTVRLVCDITLWVTHGSSCSSRFLSMRKCKESFRCCKFIQAFSGKHGASKRSSRLFFHHRSEWIPTIFLTLVKNLYRTIFCSWSCNAVCNFLDYSILVFILQVSGWKLIETVLFSSRLPWTCFSLLQVFFILSVPYIFFWSRGQKIRIRRLLVERGGDRRISG